MPYELLARNSNYYVIFERNAVPAHVRHLQSGWE